MKRTTMGLLLIAAVSALAQGEKPNFSGTWKYQPSPFARNGEVDRIQHKEPDFAMTEQVGRADVTYTFTYRTDGVEPKPERVLRNVVRTARWQGKILLLDAHFIGGVDFTDQHEELSLSEDGKTMKKKVSFTGGARPKAAQVIELTKISIGTAGIKMGDTEATVRFEWGEPAAVEHRNNQTIFTYNNEAGPLEVIFVDGKMVDSMFRKFDKAATELAQ